MRPDGLGKTVQPCGELGAVVTAAGLSSRMGDYKPLLPITGTTISRRLLSTLREAGVGHICVVTGYNAELLEEHLAGFGAVFVRNEAYRTTQMFDSVCLGLRVLRPLCDKVLFMPVDVPLFSVDTVSTLLQSDAPVAVPVCGGKRGHPILLTGPVMDAVLSDSGDGGLRGALDRSGVTEKKIEVPDRGILYDADTPEDYRTLLRLSEELAENRLG